MYILYMQIGENKAGVYVCTYYVCRQEEIRQVCMCVHIPVDRYICVQVEINHLVVSVYIYIYR